MEAEYSVVVKSEPCEAAAVVEKSGKTQAELDNDLFAKMKATERKRKPPPVVKKDEEEEGDACKNEDFNLHFCFFHFDIYINGYFDVLY